MDVMSTNEESATPAKTRNERTCAGCGKHAPAGDLVRVVHDPVSGEVAVDVASSEFGRGAHLHAAPDCFTRAFKGGLARVFKANVVGDAARLGAELVDAADRRIEGLLSGARRAGQLAIGADAVSESLRDEKAALVVVARDASAATKVPEVERAISAGKAIAFSEKQRLGTLMTRTEVAVIAVLNRGVAEAVLRTYRMSGPFQSAGRSAGAVSANEPVSADAGRSEAWSSSEVR